MRSLSRSPPPCAVYKSEANLSLGAELPGLALTTDSESLAEALRASEADLRSVTRAREVIVDAYD